MQLNHHFVADVSALSFTCIYNRPISLLTCNCVATQERFRDNYLYVLMPEWSISAPLMIKLCNFSGVGIQFTAHSLIRQYSLFDFISPNWRSLLFSVLFVASVYFINLVLWTVIFLATDLVISSIAMRGPYRNIYSYSFSRNTPSESVIADTRLSSQEIFVTLSLTAWKGISHNSRKLIPFLAV